MVKNKPQLTSGIVKSEYENIMNAGLPFLQILINLFIKSP
jgi:hypothetical protein